jgi:hypothetical protein
LLKSRSSRHDPIQNPKSKIQNHIEIYSENSVNLRNKKLNFSLDLDKVLLAIALIYLGGILFWLFRQDRLKLPFAAKPQQPPAAPARQIPAANPEFIDYLRRSLNRLERQQPAAVSPAPATVKVPAAALPSTPPPAPQSPPTVVERIYVPIYPPNQSPPQQPVSSRAKTAPAKVALPPPPPPAPTSVPVLTPGAKLLPSPAGYMLVGLLESGEVGYALFKVNGMTQRFERGEPIGSSGWTLAGVRNQTAVISRNGQQRAIEVGQSF